MEVYGEFREQSAYNSPDKPFKKHIEVAWILSTGIGLVLMLVEIGFLIALKFYGLAQRSAFSLVVGISCGLFLIPTTIMFIYFAMQFYRSLLKSNLGQKEQILEDAEKLLETNSVENVFITENSRNLNCNVSRKLSHPHTLNANLIHPGLPSQTLNYNNSSHLLHPGPTFEKINQHQHENSNHASNISHLSNLSPNIYHSHEQLRMLPIASNSNSRGISQHSTCSISSVSSKNFHSHRSHPSIGQASRNTSISKHTSNFSSKSHLEENQNNSCLSDTETDRSSHTGSSVSTVSQRSGSEMSRPLDLHSVRSALSDNLSIHSSSASHKKFKNDLKIILNDDSNSLSLSSKSKNSNYESRRNTKSISENDFQDCL